MAVAPRMGLSTAPPTLLPPCEHSHGSGLSQASSFLLHLMTPSRALLPCSPITSILPWTNWILATDYGIFHVSFISDSSATAPESLADEEKHRKHLH